jgi:hypothetical protein
MTVRAVASSLRIRSLPVHRRFHVVNAARACRGLARGVVWSPSRCPSCAPTKQSSTSPIKPSRRTMIQRSSPWCSSHSKSGADQRVYHGITAEDEQSQSPSTRHSRRLSTGEAIDHTIPDWPARNGSVAWRLMWSVSQFLSIGAPLAFFSAPSSTPIFVLLDAHSTQRAAPVEARHPYRPPIGSGQLAFRRGNGGVKRKNGSRAGHHGAGVTRWRRQGCLKSCDQRRCRATSSASQALISD